MTDAEQPTFATPSPTTSTMSTSPAVSPIDTVFYTPATSTPTPTLQRRSPSPSPMPPPRPERRPSQTPILHAAPLPNTSNSSLSTTASSSSSRTLKTPHSKLDNHMSPTVVSSYTPATTESSHNGHEEERSPTPLARRPMNKAAQQSPTLARRIEPTGNSTKQRAPPPPPPAMATGPLPPVPAQTQSQTQSRSAPAPRTRSPMPPLAEQKKHENRLSQDWTHLTLGVDVPSHHLPIDRPKSTSPLLPRDTTASVSSSLPLRPNLPPPMMMPVKKQSPQRPSFERNHSAPLSPTRKSVASRPDYKSRASLDHLRNGSGSPTPPRARKTSFSTPPQAMLDAAAAPSAPQPEKAASGRMNFFRTVSGTSKMSTPPILRSRKSEDGLRKSEDMLRKSEDMLRPSMDMYSKKELKAMQKEAQRNLGVATPPMTSRESEKDESRKASGLSLKKSSGALKALFKTGKGKDKEPTPSPPPLPDQVVKSRSRPSTSEGQRAAAAAFGESSRPRPSLSDERMLQPSSSRSRTPGVSTPDSRSVSDTQATRHGSSNGDERVQFPGRSSFSTDRAMYPSHPRSHNPRVPSDDSERTRKPSRELPPLPMPSPHDPKSFAAHQKEGEKKHSPLGEALPVSSLPYLSMMAGGSTTSPNPANPDQSPLPHTVDFTKTPPRSTHGRDARTPSPLFKSSRSLHLLSLPELDLGFDLSFDKVNGSPSTPRKTSPSKHRPGPDSPSRSVSISSPSRRASPIKRPTSERRRSQSFDGPGQDSWFNNVFDISSKFATSTSSSAPLLSKPLEPSTSDDSRQYPAAAPLPPAPVSRQTLEYTHSQSCSSQASAPSSLDHARTPSNASSTNDTSSPSPPRTPEDGKSAFPAFGLAIETTPTPSAGKAKTLGEPITLSQPPSIPLPAIPTPTPTPAIPLQTVSVVVEPIKTEKDKPELKKPRQCVRRLHTKGKVIRPEMAGTNRSLARDVERRLLGFRYPSAGTTAADRINMLKNDFMPLLLEIEKRPFDTQDEAGNGALRSVLFEWSDALLFELQIEQSAHERGACLEALSAVMESSCLSERSMQRNQRDQVRFTKMMMRVIEYVMGKLGAKGVFHNTLLFSGRTLVSLPFLQKKCSGLTKQAFAFFRIPHVGEQLVTVLQPPRGAMMRFTLSAMDGPSIPYVPFHESDNDPCPSRRLTRYRASAVPKYPTHLLPLCFDNPRAYAARLAQLSPEYSSEEERDAFLFQPGNWLRRWQSDDSELFPAFYRSYHRQLAQYLAPAIEYFESLNQPLPTSVLLRAPGYAHLATIFARKCHSYILGSVNAVTTSSNAQNFEATETAGFRGSQKPPVLETANRRLVETISTFVHTRVMVPTAGGQVIEYDGATMWTSIIDLWAKSLISKTSLYAPKGVFSLFDLLDGIVDPPTDPTSGLVQAPTLDIPHLIYTVRLILNEGEHALTLVKAIAFVFTHWEVLTADPEDRRELCLDILLKKDLFERLLLFWSQSVRSYVLRLVVFRLGHIHTKKEESGHEVEMESVQLLQARLSSIKRRHDQLEPGLDLGDEKEIDETEFRVSTPVNGGSGGGITRSRSTITMVTDSPSAATVQKPERLMGLGMGITEDERRIGGKAASWFKKLGKNKKRRDRESDSPSPIPPFDHSPSMDSAALFAPSQSSSTDTSPLMKPIPKLPTIGNGPASPAISSPTNSSESNESEGGRETKSTGKKLRPPMILTHSPSEPPAGSPTNAFSFEFELPTSSPRSDAFDPIPDYPPTSPRKSQPPSPSQAHPPTSPHMSRSFSKRSSLLPPSTARELENMLSSAQGMGSAASTPRKDTNGRLKSEVEQGYDKKLHAYAIRMLAELEDAQKEYDEWWAEGGVGKVDGAPPRLSVAWPFHEGED